MLFSLMKPRSLFRFLPLFAAIQMIVSAAAGEALTPFKSCKLTPTEWADGDSFQIQTMDGASYTIRLYGADCIEWHISDETDARRLRAQRRYFGISEFGGMPQTSITAAKELGKTAAAEVVATLAKPFTVHTAFADARGDSKHKRIYGFVTTADGEDLAERLIRLGLARAFGVYRETPIAMSAKDYQERLRDVELQAAKRGAGVWAKTDWDKLPGERQAERQEDADLELATASTKLQPGTRINPNTAVRDELMRLPGIGEVTANRIIEARPFKVITDLRNIEGIGEKTWARITPFLQIP